MGTEMKIGTEIKIGRGRGCKDMEGEDIKAEKGRSNEGPPT